MRQIFIFHFSLFRFVELEPEIVVCSIQNANRTMSRGTVILEILARSRDINFRYCIFKMADARTESLKQN